MVGVQRRDKESVGMLLRRFVRRIQQSGALIRARSIRYAVPDKSKRERKQDALKRISWKRHMDHLRKLGKAE